MRVYLLTLAMVGLLAAPVLAQDNADAKSSAAAPKPADNPKVAIMTEKARALAKDLTGEEVKALGQIRENFGYIRSIGVARRTVEKATGLCADQNPDMKDRISTRFKSWNDAITAALAKQQKNLDAAVSKKNFDHPEQVQDYLDSIDDMATYSENQIEKNIVTTPEACGNLLSSMDNTSKVILGLISDLDWPGGAQDQKAAPSEDSGAAAP